MYNRNWATKSYDESCEHVHGLLSPLLLHVTKSAEGGVTGDTHGWVPECDVDGYTAHEIEGDHVGSFCIVGDGNIAKAGNVNFAPVSLRSNIPLHRGVLSLSTSDRCHGGWPSL